MTKTKKTSSPPSIKAHATTKIERDIHNALAGDPQNPMTAELVASLYAKAHRSSHGVYSKIDWAHLRACIESILGKRGLQRCLREAAEEYQ